MNNGFSTRNNASAMRGKVNGGIFKRTLLTGGLLVALMGTPKDISGQEAQVLATNDPKKTEVVEGKERFLTLEEIANKRISKAKKGIEESEKERFDMVAQEMVDYIYKGTLSIENSVDKVVKKYNCENWKQTLRVVGKKVYTEAVTTLTLLDEANKQRDEANKQRDEANKQRDEANKQRDKANKQKLPNTEQDILSLRKLLTEGKSIEDIKKIYGDAVSQSVEALKYYKYSCQPETIEWLKQLGVSIDGLIIANVPTKK